MKLAPSDRQIARGTFKLIDGAWHKLCTGPAHDEPTYLPATDKYFHGRKSGGRNGELVSRCRLCINWSKLKSPGSEQGWIPIEKVIPFYEEAVNRVGLTELSLRANVSTNHINSVLHKEQANVQKATFRKIMLELISMRRHNEYSIRPEARRRNRNRIHRDYDLCSGCGTPKTNFTKGCDNCLNRFYKLFKKGKISSEEWENLKAD